ncbi:MAG: nucleotide pyrophosphohydrolase [Gammaproteobacteria bacterium]|nr:nucleotide pyrophosphohydrolase [Gammaproteobacteria bacterium]
MTKLQEGSDNVINNDINTLKRLMRDFADKRDWNQFHSPKNLSMALSVEVAELVEHFQWLTEEQSRNLPKDILDKVSNELADTLLYLVRIADKLDIDLMTAVQNKMRLNEQKYPVEKARGNAKKYTEFS